MSRVTRANSCNCILSTNGENKNESILSFHIVLGAPDSDDQMQAGTVAAYVWHIMERALDTLT